MSIIQHVLAALALTALAMAFATRASAAEGPPTISGGLVRPAPLGRTTAAYFTLKGAGTADRLLSASSPVADRIELHESTEVDGMMRMQALDQGLAVPADGLVELKPGGLHLMFLGLKRPLAPGDTVPVTLTFESAGEVTLSLPVAVPPLPAKTEGHGHHHHR